MPLSSNGRSASTCCRPRAPSAGMARIPTASMWIGASASRSGRTDSGSLFVSRTRRGRWGSAGDGGGDGPGSLFELGYFVYTSIAYRDTVVAPVLIFSFVRAREEGGLLFRGFIFVARVVQPLQRSLRHDFQDRESNTVRLASEKSGFVLQSSS